MTPKLSPTTQNLVEVIFDVMNVNEAARWLEDECGNNIPFCAKHDEYAMERIRFAALKLSNGNISKLLGAIDEARIDWRDLFMVAGFGHDIKAHVKWAAEILNKA